MAFRYRSAASDLLVAQRLAQLSAQAARKADQPLGVFRQILFAHPRLPVEPVQARLRRQPDQVLVSLLVLGQHQQVVVLAVPRVARRRQAHTAGVASIPRRLRAMVLRLAHVELAAQDRLHALFLGRIEKVHRAVDVPVVRHGHGLLPQRRHAIRQLIDVAGAVQQRVFGMQMQVGEFSHG